MGLCNYARSAHRPQTAEEGFEGIDDNDDQRQRVDGGGGGDITRNDDQPFFDGVALGAPDRHLWPLDVASQAIQINVGDENSSTK
jgi:hypothetical protein